MGWLEKASDARLSVILFVAAAFWGLYWVPIRLLGSFGFSESMSVVALNAAPLLVLLPWLILRRNARDWDNWPRVVAISAFLGLGLASYAVGIAATSVVRTTLLFYLVPVWGTIIGCAFLGEKLTLGRVLAIVLGLLGLVMLMSGAADSAVPLGIGDALGLLSGISWAIGSAGLKRWPETSAFVSTTWQFVFVCLFAMLLGAMLFPQDSGEGADILAGLSVVLPIGLLVLLPSVLLILWICRKIYPGRAGLLMMSEVIVAILSAAIFLPQETMNLVQWGGAGLIVVACLCEIWAGARQG